MTKRVLLISNSTLYGSGYLDQAEREIRDFLESASRIVFVPFALYDRGRYAAQARERFRTWERRSKSAFFSFWRKTMRP